MTAVRHATLSVTYKGMNITAALAPHLREFSYTDNAHGNADDLSIALEDSARLWQGSWIPVK
ncbi:MAG: late control protein, partial [Pseudodesulfovibrio sp.]